MTMTDEDRGAAGRAGPAPLPRPANASTHDAPPRQAVD